MQKLWCWLGFHKWSSWSEGERYGHTYWRQSRRCTCCNYYTETIHS